MQGMVSEVSGELVLGDQCSPEPQPLELLEDNSSAPQGSAVGLHD